MPHAVTHTNAHRTESEEITMNDQHSPEAKSDDVEGHRVMSGDFGDDTVPRNSADSRPKKAELSDDDDVEGHTMITQTGRPAHEMDRER